MAVKILKLTHQLASANNNSAVIPKPSNKLQQVKRHEGLST